MFQVIKDRHYMPPCLSVYRIIRYSDQVHCLIFVYRKVNRYVYCSSDPLLLFVVVNEQLHLKLHGT